MTLTVRTNHAWRPFVYRNEVPAAVLASDFDYQDAENATDGFFCYRGTWYHLDMFTAAPASLKGWNGVHADSYSSGVVINVSEDGESYQVGTYFA